MPQPGVPALPSRARLSASLGKLACDLYRSLAHCTPIRNDHDITFKTGIVELPLSAEADGGDLPHTGHAAARETAGRSSADSGNRNGDLTGSDAGIDAGERAPEHATDTAAGGSDGDATDSEDALGGDRSDLHGVEPSAERPGGCGAEAAGGDGAAAAAASNEADAALPTAPRPDGGLVSGDVQQPRQAAAAGSSPLASRPASLGEVKPSWTELQRERAVLDLTVDDDDGDDK
jgi:hypothetical protein